MSFLVLHIFSYCCYNCEMFKLLNVVQVKYFTNGLHYY